MSAKLELKQTIVEEIKQKLEKAKSVTFVDYRGLTVEMDTKLRADFRKIGAEYKVYKNRLVQRALNELGITGLESQLEGTNAVAFGYNDEVGPAKLLKDVSTDKVKMEVKCGILYGKAVAAQEMTKLANIPPRDVLVAQLLFMLQSPTRGLACAIKAIAEKNV